MQANTVTAIRQTADELREQVRTVLESMSQTEFARLADASGTTISRWLKNTYEGDNAKLERKIEAALGSLAERKSQARSMPTAPDFVETPTALRVLDSLKYAHVASDLVVIYGGAGTGKTEVAKHYQASSPNVWCVTITEATSNVLAALEEIADAVGIPPMTGPGGRPSAAAAYRAIIKKMSGTFGLLILDEAQNLAPKTLDQVRQIHDATECGLVLMGNERTYSQLTGGNRAAYLDRLFSRVGQRLQLGQPTDQDVAAIIDAWQVQTGECKDLLRKIARTPGGLRSLTKTLRLASMFASGDGRALNCSDCRAAWKRLGGVQ